MGFIQWSEPQLISAFFILIRVSTILFMLPMLGDKTIPASIKILFSVAVTFILLPVLQKMGVALDPSRLQSGAELVLAVGCEFLTGAFIGFFSRLIFDAVKASAHFMGTQMGFSMGSILDPQSEQQTIALAEFQYVLTGLLFLSMDGHHIYIQSIADSFHWVPLGRLPVLDKGSVAVEQLIRLTSQTLLLSVHLAAPILVAMFLVNLAFGLVSRAVPQINMLVISFAANILVGLAIFMISLPSFQSVVLSEFETYSANLQSFLKFLGK